jgi:long-chain acyl-CoA synthetase
MPEHGLWRIASTRPDSIAVIGPDGSTLTAGELAATADRYGRGLQALGLSPGDVIAVLLPNGLELMSLYFAAYETGLHIVPVNWHLVAPEVGYLLRDSGARAFVAHAQFADVAAAAADEADLKNRFAVGDIPGFSALSSLGADEPATRPDVRTAGGPMVYTSGTTGRPKGVKRPLTGADPDDPPAAGRWFLGIFGIEPFDEHVHLCCSPLYHTAVLNFASLAVQMGHPLVLMDGFDAEEMLRLIARYRVTYSHMVPTQFKRLLALPSEVREQYDVSSLRAMIHGAAPCPPDVKRKMIEWWGPVVVDYYAATEGGGTMITAAEWLERPGSVGLPWPGSTIRVLDDDGAEVPTGETGLIYMQMGNSDFSYHQDPEKTRAARVGKLFTLGDVGYLDSDGYLYLCDRKADMIITGGVNVYPAEIENELSAHPDVADVAVFGIPHPEWGEEIKAVVQPAPGVPADDALRERLLEHARARLARFKVPRSVDFADELPRDPNGKLYKRRLRDPYWTGADRAI